MRKLLLDLRGVGCECDNAEADCPARVEVENALLDYAGYIVNVKITKLRQPKLQEKKG